MSNIYILPVIFIICGQLSGISSSSISLSVYKQEKQELALKEKYAKNGFEFIGSAEGKIFLRPFDIGNTYWTTALGHCFNAGYRLAQINSTAQENVLKSFKESSVWFWIDGTDSVEEGVWRSIYSGAKLPYLNWSPPAPNGGTEENCLFWMQNSYYIGMKDGSCRTEVNHVLCETST